MGFHWRFSGSVGTVLALVLSALVAGGAAQSATADEPLKLPWDAGGWNVTQGRHQTNAWDLQPPGAGSHNDEVLAITSGTAKLTCSDSIGQAIVQLNVNGSTFKYAHLQTSAVQAAGITSGGVPVVQGQVLGRLLPSGGGFSGACGSGQASHLHLEMPFVPITIDGITFSADGPGYLTRLNSTNRRVDGNTAAHSPRGAYDELQSPAPGRIRVRGWAFDPDNTGAQINVHVYVGGPAGSPGARGIDVGPANTHRPDVGAAFPGVGDHHGFDVTFDNPGGAYPVFVYAINLGAGDNVLLGRRDVNVADPNPLGSFDEVVSPQGGELNIRGWAFDPNDVSVPLAFHVYVGGPAGDPQAQGFAFGPADALRPDVDAVYPGVGDRHGIDWSFATTKAGVQPVYLYAINIGPGENPLLGARTVDIGQGPPRIRPMSTPRIRGRARVGKTLRTAPVAWSVTDIRASVQWLRNGRVVPGATGASYRLRRPDRGTRISVRTSAVKEGYIAGTGTSVRTKPVKARS